MTTRKLEARGRWEQAADITRAMRMAGRSLRRAPGFATAVVLTLSFGMALVASVIAIVNGYVARALPYPDVGRLFHVMYAPPGPVEPRGVTPIDWNGLRDVIENPITTSGDTYYIGGDAGFAQSVRGLRVSQGFLAALRVQPAVGRSFAADDFAGGSESPVMIGHALWRDRFGGDASIVGRTLRVESENAPGTTETLRIIGVLPPGFWFGRDSRAPVELMRPLLVPVRTYMVQLREGVSPAQAEQRLTAAARAIATWIPPDWTGVHLENVHERYVANLRPTLRAIVVAAALVLAIACANVAVLVLLRTLRRQREMAVRVSLGAGRRHLLGMFGLEIGLLGFVAVVVGLAATTGILRGLSPLIETQLGRPSARGTAGITVDPMVLLVVAGIGVVIALSLSLVPMLAPWPRRIPDLLRRGGGTTSDGATMRWVRSTLIAVEIGGSLALLVGAGLMIRSASALLRTDLGFDATGVQRARIVLRGARYRDAAALERFYETLNARLTTISATPPALVEGVPFYEPPTQPVEADVGESRTNAVVSGVGGGYFATLSIPLEEGRAFTAADRSTSSPVAIINESLARRLWPGRSALGRRLRTTEQTGAGPVTSEWRTVVGVVGDVRQTYEDATTDDVYVPQLQTSLDRFVSVQARTTQTSAAFTAALRSMVASIDPSPVVNDARAVDTEDVQLSRARFMRSMLTGFAVCAGLLAVFGIYGVIAFAAKQRERELAIRVAIGATYGAVIALFVRDGARMIAAGLVIGVPAAVATARLLEHQLFGVRPFDVTTLLLATIALVAAAAFGIWWPARQAARRNPVGALSQG